MAGAWSAPASAASLQAAEAGKDQMEILTGLSPAARRGEFEKPKMDPRFRPRGSPEVKPQPPQKRVVAPLMPQQWPEQAYEEDTDDLKERWERREEPETVREKIRRALTIPEHPFTPAPRSSSTSSGPSTMGPTAPTQWQQLGNGIRASDNIHHRAGRIRAAAYAYDSSQGLTVLYLGSSGGGLWKAVYAGLLAIWVPISDTLPGSPSVGAFAVNSQNSNLILIGSGDSYRYSGTGMYRSTDGGTTWTLTDLSPAPAAFQKIIAHRDNANLVIASGDNGIFRSTDFGAHWVQVYSGSTSDLVQDPVYHSYWYAGAPGIGVLESSDSGQTWHQINGNGGNGLTDPIGRISLAVSDSAPNYVYAVAEGNSGVLGGIYRSNNYGYDWVRIDSVDTISWGQAFHTTAIGVDPTTPDRLFVGMGGVQWTANATAATPCWTRNVGSGCTGCSSICVDGGHADFTSFLFVPGSSTSPSTSVIMTTDGGYYVYNWASNSISGTGNTMGLNVEQTMQPDGSLASARMDPEVLLAGLQDNGMTRYNSSNTTWLALGGGDGGQANISPDNTTDFFFSSGAAYYRFYSTDQGANWVGVNCTFPNQWTSTVMHDSTPGGYNMMYTNTDDYLWYKPISGTCDWLKANGSPFPTSFAAKQFDQANNTSTYVFYVTAWNSGTLYVLDSPAIGSITPVDRTPPLPVGSSRNDAMVFADRSSLQPNTVYYTTAGARPSRAYLSTNRGVTWQDVTGNLTTLLPNANYWKLVGNPANLNQLFLATDVGVFRSDDRGVTWYRYSTGLPAQESINGLELNYDNVSAPVLHIGTYGRGFWRRVID